MRHLELFSGIGGFRRALDLLSNDCDINFESIGYSEIDEKAQITYMSNYIIEDDEAILGNISAFVSSDTNVKSLPNFDLLTGGFPCQTFSMMGQLDGFKGDRGQMFFKILNILGRKRPRYVLLENVKNLYTHNKQQTYKRIKKELEDLGYNVISGIFNTAEFYLPQIRNRVFIFASQDPLPIDMLSSEEVRANLDANLEACSINRYKDVLDILSPKVDVKYYLSEKVKPTILSDGTGGYNAKSEINRRIARPLTASMHKMHRACQDNYYCDDFILSKGENNHTITLDKDEQCKMNIRRITPEEAFMLQGFPVEFVHNARNAGVSNGALYKQAGNAVSVNTVYAIVLYLINNGYINEQ
ncbi:DNA (cytosine-5-)-methyltransferase [Bacteroides sp.]|uniref:DNA cytosine methyltransferase n=1 Tax=Bacteroides sp. TaxID=29523 RepID=UPI002FCAB5A0